MTPIDKFKAAKAEHVSVKTANLDAIRQVFERFQKPLAEAHRKFVTAMLGLTMREMLEVSIGTNLTIAEKISLGDSLDRKVGTILPKPLVDDMLAGKIAVDDMARQAYAATDAKERVKVVEKDLADAEGVKKVDMGNGVSAYHASFNTENEMVAFLIETFGVTREKAIEMARSGS